MLRQPTRILVVVKGRRYTVIRDDVGLIGIEATNAVMGVRRIDVTGRTAKTVLAALAEQEIESNKVRS